MVSRNAADRLVDMLYRLRARFDLATGGVDRAAVRLARRINWRDSQPGRPTVLCFNRALFAKDLGEMRRHCRINLPTVHTARVKKPQQRWVAERWQVQTFFTDWLHTELPATRPLLVRFATRFLREASRTHPIDAVMAANVDYWQDEAFRLACRELGIPFLVLSRESYGIPYWRTALHKRFGDANFTFAGKGVAVASENCVRCLATTAAMQGIRIEATGYPRYDQWLGDGTGAPERSAVTLMSYADRNYHAPENFRQVLDLFLARAAAHRTTSPESPLDFVVKIKKPADQPGLEALNPRLRDPALRITVTADEPLPQLVRRSRMVIGFNTLAMLESLLGGTAVVVPCWADARREKEMTLLHHGEPDDREVAYFPESEVALAELLDQAIAGTLKPKASEEVRFRRFSRQSVVRSDEPASLRVERFILECLQG